MPSPRPFACIQTEDQWRRAAYHNAALVAGEVLLGWSEEQPLNQETKNLLPPAGLAFDDSCRLYHSIPEQGRVRRLLWSVERTTAVDLFGIPEPTAVGDFVSAPPTSLFLNRPSALALDAAGRLYVAEPPNNRIRLFDFHDRRLLEAWNTNGEPVDFARSGEGILALLSSPASLLLFSGRGDPAVLPLPAGVTAPGRIAIHPDGSLFVLDQPGAAQAQIVSFKHPRLAIPRATDIEFQAEGNLVVARHPDEDILRFRVTTGAIEEIASLKGRRYDGRGIVLTPDNRIGFWTELGFRHAVSARIRYVPSGRVTGFRLDSGDFQTNWGRLFFDACIPLGTSVQIHCIASDEPPAEPELPRTPPVNVASMEIYRPDLSPPMPPLSFVPADEGIERVLFLRKSPDQPWPTVSHGDSFRTYEAPVIAGAGRYLWVTLLLKGDSRETPRLRGLRAEYPSHDYLRRLPRVFSREPESETFLRRYLAIFEGPLGEFEAKAVLRNALLDPGGAAESILPWLATFVGLTLDERWPVAARRTLVSEAILLFRFRGTVAGLSRFLEIYLGVKPVFIEKYRLRGLGGAIAGGAEPQSSAILGAGFRVGGVIGEEGSHPLEGTLDDAFTTHAHRFSVVIQRPLTSEQLAVVTHILDVHRPAHTLYDVCTAGSGMRVGSGLYVELSSVIGGTGGFRVLQLDASLLGRSSILGRPQPGISLAASRLGEDSRVG